MMFELNRGQVPDGGVQAGGVVPVHLVGDLPLDVAAVFPGGPAVVDGLGLEDLIRPLQQTCRAALSPGFRGYAVGTIMSARCSGAVRPVRWVSWETRPGVMSSMTAVSRTE